MRGELGSPFTSASVIKRAIRLVDDRDVRDKGVVGVRVCQQRRDGQEHGVDGQRGAPLVLQDVQADVPLGVDVGVVHLRGEFDLGRLEGVVRGEVDGQVEHAADVRGALGADDGGGPLADIGPAGPGADVGERVLLHVSHLLVDTFYCCHFYLFIYFCVCVWLCVFVFFVFVFVILWWLLFFCVCFCV